MASTILLKTCLKSGLGTSCESVVDPRPLNPGTLHSSFLIASPAPHTYPSLKPGQGTRTVSPEKATGSQETAPLLDHSQEISAAQSHSSCSALPVPHPSPEARSGEGRLWLVHFLRHCLPDNGQSSTESDQGLTTPETQIRAKGRGAGRGEGSCQQGQMTRETLHRLGRGRREAKQRYPRSRQSPPPHAGHWPQHSDRARAQVTGHLSTSTQHSTAGGM